MVPFERHGSPLSAMGPLYAPWARNNVPAVPTLLRPAGLSCWCGCMLGGGLQPTEGKLDFYVILPGWPCSISANVMC